MMYKYANLFLGSVVGMLLCLSIYSCSGSKEQSSCPELKVDLSLKSPAMDELFSRVEVVPFEDHNDSCLLMRLTRVLPYKDKIYVVDRRRPACYVFDKDGSFVRQIGRMGNGPGEYFQIEDCMIDEGRQEIILLDCNGILFVYDLDGKFLRRLRLEWGACQSLVATGDGNAALWFLTGEAQEAVKIFDDKGQYVKGYLHQPAYFNYMILHPFYTYDGKAYLGSGCFSTVYTLSSDTLKVAYQWDFGDKGINPNVLDLLSKEDGSQTWSLVQEYLDDGTLAFSIEGHDQTDKYYYARLVKTSYNKFYCNVFYDKQSGQSFVFDKMKEGFTVYPVAMNNDYLLSVLNYEDIKYMKDILPAEEYAKLSALDEESNPCLLRMYFK